MKKILVLVSLVVSLILIVSCQQANKPVAKAALAVAMVTDVGGVNDQSFNQSAWEGLQRAEKELGLKASYVESKQESDYAPNFQNLIDAKADLIWGIGFLMGDAVKNAALNNPNNKFAIIDYAYETTPANIEGVVFKEEEPSFLMGYIAATMSKTGKVGFVGGMKIPVIEHFDAGYAAGVAWANNVKGLSVKVLNQYAESFTDAAKGKAIALSMYQEGADIVFHAAGNVGNGVIEAAKEQNKFAIGVDRDQNYLAPDNVLSSAMKRVDNAVYTLSKELADGVFQGGSTRVLGLKEGGVDIAPSSSKLVSPEILAEVEKLKQEIIAGKIVVPNNFAALATFVGSLKK